MTYGEPKFTGEGYEFGGGQSFQLLPDRESDEISILESAANQIEEIANKLRLQARELGKQELQRHKTQVERLRGYAE